MAEKKKKVTKKASKRVEKIDSGISISTHTTITAEQEEREAKEEELLSQKATCISTTDSESVETKPTDKTPLIDWEKVEVEQPQRTITRKRRKKVAIVGCADSKNEAPFADDEFEIWGVNNLYPLIEAHKDRYRWFEIHEITKEDNILMRRHDPIFRGQNVGEYVAQLGQWANEINCPVYMQKVWPEVPTSMVYPLKAMIEKYGNYFTNSISYMLALAIHEGFEEIHVYGVDMAVDTEYHHQRPSCEYFLGLAQGMGIKTYIPDTADLLKVRFLYGFDEPKETKWEKKCKSILKMMNTKRAKEEQISKIAESKIQQYIGAEQAIKELSKIWG